MSDDTVRVSHDALEAHRTALRDNATAAELFRRESDRRIIKIENALERVAERMERMSKQMEQVAVLIHQEKHNETRLHKLETQVAEITTRSTINSTAINKFERILWIGLAAILAGGQEISAWIASFFTDGE